MVWSFCFICIPVFRSGLRVQLILDQAPPDQVFEKAVVVEMRVLDLPVFEPASPARPARWQFEVSLRPLEPIGLGTRQSAIVLASNDEVKRLQGFQDFAPFNASMSWLGERLPPNSPLAISLRQICDFDPLRDL
jgi:hypothetical protein